MNKNNNKKFPENFLWGASTSAYQFEGGWDLGGKGKSIQDVKKILNKETSDFKVASDHYNHWKEDVALMKEMGFTSYRFSIAWTRIIPNGVGEVNEEGVKFYSDLIDELKKSGIEPIITMFHFDMPLELQNQGGWFNRDIIVPAFEKYANTLFDRFGDKVKYWITVNEQNVLLLQGPVVGLLRPENINPLKYIFQSNHNINIAQAIVMKICHKRFGKNVFIGNAPNISSIYPASSKPEDQVAAKNIGVLRNWFYLDAIIKGIYHPIVMNLLKENDSLFEIREGDIQILKDANPDFIAFNYYTTTTVEMSKPIKDYVLPSQERVFGFPGFGQSVSNPNLNKTQFNWEIDPVGLLNTVRELDERYNLPLMITENGIGGYDKLDNGKINDEYRIEYISEHLKNLKYSIDEGANVIGYNSWSAFDLISVHEGISKRYGFVFVDRDEKDVKNCNRIRKQSSYWYEKIIKSNGEDLFKPY